MTPRRPEEPTDPAAPPTATRRTASVRVRILGWYVILLAVALIAALVIQRTVLIRTEANDAEQALDQEVGELRQLAQGIDPATGQPFANDVEAIFDTFLSRNVPLVGEGILTFVNGSIYKTDVTGSTMAELPIVDTWATATTSVRGAVVDPDLGEVRYLAVPLLDDGSSDGVFVVAVLTDDRFASVDQAVRLGAVVYGSVFVLASVLAWVAAGRILRPLRGLTSTARSISDSDLSGRIDVTGDDEIAELGRTFNDMLDRLDTAFEGQRRFVDDAGHELRTPITVIRGQLEVMGDDPTERAATIAVVTDELDRMSRIVDDLLDLAKVEQPDFVRLGPIDLDEFVQGIAAKAAGLDDRPWVVDEATPAVFHADRQRLDQAMMNLVRNVIEHVPGSEPVHLGGRAEDDRVELWVCDRGPGIALSDRDRIFERFARGRTSRHGDAGAGLGLAIVAAIAEAHGGTVTVEDAAERGTVFTIVLPQNPGESEVTV